MKIKGSITTCENCKDPFLTKRNDKKYCTNSCKQKAYKKRKLGKSCTRISWIKKPVIILKKVSRIKRFLQLFW